MEANSGFCEGTGEFDDLIPSLSVYDSTRRIQRQALFRVARTMQTSDLGRAATEGDARQRAILASSDIRERIS